jgi:hypothetical protein
MAKFTNSNLRDMAVSAFHGIIILLLAKIMPHHSVTYVSEQVLPISPVYTDKRGWGSYDKEDA